MSQKKEFVQIKTVKSKLKLQTKISTGINRKRF